MLSLPTGLVRRMTRPLLRGGVGAAGPGSCEGAGWPTVLHVTHGKAGSQWVHKILHQCAPERVVAPRYGMAQFFKAPVERGKIYPTLYVSREQFDGVALPREARRFVVIRDLRDTLVSWYFSLKHSHAVDHPLVAECRAAPRARSLEDGLLWGLGNPQFGQCAVIQRSWQESGERVIRYEDLLRRDEEILLRVLLRDCGLPVGCDRLRQIIHANRFERLTGGRPRGQEDVSAHERKGIAGDWCNHFTDRVKRAFKDRFGDLLVATGYEKGLDW
jgi:lipopolysaccharide transport system ATP-binding protein